MLKRPILTTGAIAIGAFLIVSGILTLLFFQSIVDIVIASRLPLKEGTETLELWRKPPATPILRVYFFNVTNAQEFLNRNGTIKLVLQEFGPYTYSEKWEKVNLTWHPNGTLSYRQKKLFFFEPSLSQGTEDDVFVLPNIPLLTALSSLKYSTGVAKKAVSTILEILKLQPFHEQNVRNMMWGYDDPLLKLGKSILPEGKRVPFDKFGLFYGKNNTPGQVFTVFSGQEKLGDYARINVWNGKTRLGLWRNPYDDRTGDNCSKSEVNEDDEESEETEVEQCVRPERADDYCNMINGTDATGFPSMLTESSRLYVFQPDLCRTLELKYVESTTQQEIPVYRFVPTDSTFGDVETFPENECYCLDGPPCSRRGTFNISVCQFGSPVFISFPHFLHGDPSLVSAVEGLHPDPSRHQFYIDIQPKLGIPMQAKGRVQINIQMMRIPEIPQAAKLDNVLIPVIWFEDGIEKLPEKITSLLRQAIFVPGIAKVALTIGCFGFGCVLVLFGVIVMAKSYMKTRKHGLRSTMSPEPHVEKSNGIHKTMTIPYTNGGLELEEKKVVPTNGHSTTNGNGKGMENLGKETAT